MGNGITRTVDKMGRVVIPKEIRKQLKVENEIDSFDISLDGDKVILRKHHSACLFCNTIAPSVEYAGYNVCCDCIEKLYIAKDNIKENIDK